VTLGRTAFTLPDNFPASANTRGFVVFQNMNNVNGQGTPFRAGVELQLRCICFVSCVRVRDDAVRESRAVATSPQIAAKESQAPGTARLPVKWIRYVQMAGVKPPNTAVARL